MYKLVPDELLWLLWTSFSSSMNCWFSHCQLNCQQPGLACNWVQVYVSLGRTTAPSWVTKKSPSSSVNQLLCRDFEKATDHTHDCPCHALGYDCCTPGLTGCARPLLQPLWKNALFARSHLVLILTGCTICEGKLILSHIFVSTNVWAAMPGLCSSSQRQQHGRWAAFPGLGIGTCYFSIRNNIQ